MGISRPKSPSGEYEQDPQPIETLIADLASLPPLPRQAQILLSELADPELDIPRLVELLQLAPSLSARLLGIARSAFFAGPVPARDLHDALVRVLGLNLVRDLGICFLLSNQLPVDQCPAYRPERYWKRAVMTATLAESLAPMVCTAEPGELADAYLAGLLHNLGLPAMVHVAPGAMTQVLKQADRDTEPALAEIERGTLGIDHHAAGQRLAAAWHLPADVGAAMAHHANSRYRGEHRWLVALIGLCERYCAHVEHATEAAPGYSHLGIGTQNWERATAAWRSRLDEVSDLARAFT